MIDGSTEQYGQKIIEDQGIRKIIAISKAVLHFLMLDPRSSTVQVCDVMALSLLFSCWFPLLAGQEQTTSTKTYARPEQPLLQPLAASG